MFDNENSAVYAEEESSITSATPTKASKPNKRKKVSVKKTLSKKTSKKAKNVLKAPEVKKAPKKSAKTGTRYSPAEKQKVLDFVKNNAGYGVMNKAMREF